MNKKAATLPLKSAVIAVVVFIGIFSLIYAFGPFKILGLSKNLSETIAPFDNVCCCKESDANDCAEWLRKECEQQEGFVVIDDMKNCEVT